MNARWVVIRQGMDDPANFYIYPSTQRGLEDEAAADTLAESEARRCPGVNVFVARLIRKCSVEPLLVTWKEIR